MAEHAELQGKIHYDPAGTLVRPGQIGRLLRLLLGFLCLSIVWDIFTGADVSEASSVSWWVLIGLGLVLVNYVVNIGFGLSIGNWPFIGSALLIAGAAIFSLLATGNLLDYPLWISVTGWQVYVFGHLGMSFLLAAILATPGCEMRALPHLIGLARGEQVAEHYCPAFIDSVDKWEHARKQGIEETEKLEANDPRSRDLFGSVDRVLLIYGLSFVAIQLAGNFGNFVVATRVPALAFLFIAVICLSNIARCRRVHCYLTGPLFLALGIALGLYSFRLFSFGADTWSILVNSGLIGGACLSFHMEMMWGRYFGDKPNAA